MYQADTKAAKWYYKNEIYYLAYGSGYISKNYMATYLWYLLYGSQFPPWNTSN